MTGPMEAERRLLTLELWLAATASDTGVADMRRREQAIAYLNPHSASQMPDVLTDSPADSSEIWEVSREASSVVGSAPGEATSGGH